MITSTEKDKLAEINGFGEGRRTDKIRESVRKKYRLEDEAAIARKMIKRLFELVVELHGKEIADEVIAEFNQYFEDVEKIKEEVDGA